MPAKRVFATAAYLATACACAAQSPAPGAPAVTQAAPPVAGATFQAAPPPLVVLIVIDQLGSSLLQRYADLYTGGFRRLLTEGRVYMNASHNHAITSTAPGHAAIATGVYPSRNGIVSNAWYQKSGGQWVGMSNVGDAG